MADMINAEYDEEIQKLLDENTTSKYYIEYEGFKTNHLSQALVALAKLYSPISMIKQFVQWMKDVKLEDKELHEKNERSLGPVPQNPMDVLGKEQHYYFLKDLYTKLLHNEYDGSFESLVAGEFPKLSSGVLGAATHGLIHTGYGCSSKKSWFVVEGLAYLHDQYASPVCNYADFDIWTLGEGSKDILDVVALIHDDTQLIQSMNDGAESGRYDKYDSRFERKMYALYSSGGNDLLKYVHMIKFPDGLNGKDFTKEKVQNLANWIINCAIIVYALSKNHNDFFLLHGVTSSWALKNILQLLSTSKDILKCVRDYIITLLSVYLIQEHPSLQLNLLKDNDGMSHSWDVLVKKAIEHDDREREHMFKLVQVCKMLNDENPGSEMESMYRFACHCCVDYPFHFGNE